MRFFSGHVAIRGLIIPNIHFREHWKGYLWQGRFALNPMNKCWLLRVAAYVELDPVNAGIIDNAWNYRWSSVHAHLAGNNDSEGIVQTEKLFSLVGYWKTYLKENQGHSSEEVEQHERTGRPLGDDCLIQKG